MCACRNICDFISRLVTDKMFPSLPQGLVNSFNHQPVPLPLSPHSFLTLPALLLLLLLSSSSHHICFSSCRIPVFPKRILTCGFDELKRSHTLSQFLFSLFHYLILFSISQSLPPCPNRCTHSRQHTLTHSHEHNTHTTPSPVECLMIMWSVSVILRVYWVISFLFLYSQLLCLSHYGLQFSDIIL